VFIGWLVGDHMLLLRGFGLYVIYMNVCLVITVAVVWGSFAVKGLWAYAVIQQLPL
jgi:hypothetical protein